MDTKTLLARWEKVRRALRHSSDGLTARQVAEQTNMSKLQAQEHLTSMPDVYIDRWDYWRSSQGYTAIYMLAHVPRNCPRPSAKPKPQPPTEGEP